MKKSFRSILDDIQNSKASYWINVFLFDKEINLRAGVLTFFSLSGIVPICVFFLWTADFLMADVSVSRMTTLLFRDVGDSLETLSLFPRIKIGQLLSSFAGWIAIVLIVFYLNAFFNNIQYAFNYIWQSEDRTRLVDINTDISLKEMLPSVKIISEATKRNEYEKSGNSLLKKHNRHSQISVTLPAHLPISIITAIPRTINKNFIAHSIINLNAKKIPLSDRFRHSSSHFRRIKGSLVWDDKSHNTFHIQTPGLADAQARIAAYKKAHPAN